MHVKNVQIGDPPWFSIQFNYCQVAAKVSEVTCSRHVMQAYAGIAIDYSSVSTTNVWQIQADRESCRSTHGSCLHTKQPEKTSSICDLSQPSWSALKLKHQLITVGMIAAIEQSMWARSPLCAPWLSVCSRKIKITILLGDLQPLCSLLSIYLLAQKKKKKNTDRILSGCWNESSIQIHHFLVWCSMTAADVSSALKSTGRMEPQSQGHKPTVLDLQPCGTIGRGAQRHQLRTPPFSSCITKHSSHEMNPLRLPRFHFGVF